MGAPGETFHPGDDRRPIVAFDFDGTLTWKDSFQAYLRWRAGPAGYVIGLIRLAPAAARYLLDRDRGQLKAAAVTTYLAGAAPDDIRRSAGEFAAGHAAALLRPDAVRCWNDWRAKGARLVVVTASPEIIVAPFAQALGAELTIGSRLAVGADGRLSGALDGRNCRGAEKVTRLTARFGSDVRLAAAYGDSAGDREMLAIADDPGYRVFSKRP